MVASVRCVCVCDGRDIAEVERGRRREEAPALDDYIPLSSLSQASNRGKQTLSARV
jgi:hypothetical protein